jgi:hypothetical protein
MQLLIDTGADLTRTENDGETILISVCRKSRPIEMVSLILQNGAILGSEYEGKDAIDYCHDNHRTDLITLLSNWPPVKTAGFR